jgi:hypothetical protein
MSKAAFVVERRSLRGTDSNSLLRLYDVAHAVFSKSTLLQERARAEKAIRRIANELHKRNIRV